MGYFRFHRSVGNKFFRLNFSKRGMSITGGVPGAHINVPIVGKKRRPMGTLSLPGTGLSYRQTLGKPTSGTPNEFTAFVIGLIVILILYYWLG